MSLGVFLFGYDQGVMSGILTYGPSIFVPTSYFVWGLTSQLLQWTLLHRLLRSSLARSRRDYGSYPRSGRIHLLPRCRSNWRHYRAQEDNLLWIVCLPRGRRSSNFLQRHAADDAWASDCWVRRRYPFHYCTCLPVRDLTASQSRQVGLH